MISQRVTTDTTIYLGACKFFGAIVDGDGTNNFDVIVKDSATEKFRAGVTAPGRYGGALLGNGQGDEDWILIETSLVADITGSGGGVTIYYAKVDPR